MVETHRPPNKNHYSQNSNLLVKDLKVQLAKAKLLDKLESNSYKYEDEEANEKLLNQNPHITSNIKEDPKLRHKQRFIYHHNNEMYHGVIPGNPQTHPQMQMQPGHQLPNFYYQPPLHPQMYQIYDPQMPYYLPPAPTYQNQPPHYRDSPGEKQSLWVEISDKSWDSKTGSLKGSPISGGPSRQRSYFNHKKTNPDNGSVNAKFITTSFL